MIFAAGIQHAAQHHIPPFVGLTREHDFKNCPLSGNADRPPTAKGSFRRNETECRLHHVGRMGLLRIGTYGSSGIVDAEHRSVRK